MPKNNRTSDEIIRDMHNKKEVARKRKLITERFYPALSAATVSVDESKMLLSAINSVMMERVLATMKERKFSDIKKDVLAIITSDGERKSEISKLLSTLDSETLYVSREITEGASRAIEQMIMEDMRSRGLDTLKPDWDRYLN